MHWTTAFSHSTQAIRRPISKLAPRRGWWVLAELSADLLGLIGLTAWAVAWIGLMLYLAV